MFSNQDQPDQSLKPRPTESADPALADLGSGGLPGSRVRVFELMILVAAVGLGLIGTRQCDAQMREIQMDRHNLVNWLILVSPPLMLVAMALTMIRLLPPRPRLVECFRQPGHVANLVASLIMLFHTFTLFSVNSGNFKSFDTSIRLFNYAFFWPSVAGNGGGVLIAWLTLGMVGCWRPEPTWSDRSGRVLGAFSILTYLAAQFAWMLRLPWLP